MINYRPDAEFLVQHFPGNSHSARLRSKHSDCLCLILDKWPSARTNYSTGAQEVPFDWKSSFNPQNTRMGRLRSGDKNTVRDRDFDPSFSLRRMFCADSDIILVNVLGTSMIILNSYDIATDLLYQRSSTYYSR